MKYVFLFFTFCFVIAGGIANDIYNYETIGASLWICSVVSGVVFIILDSAFPNN